MCVVRGTSESENGPGSIADPRISVYGIVNDRVHTDSFKIWGKLIRWLPMKYWICSVLLLLGAPAFARAESVHDMTFPVIGDVSYADTFTAARSGGRIHHATDIMGEKMLPVVAAVDGTILFAPMVEPSYGYMIMLGGDDGYQYNYVHLNNDTPGTDDGLGGPEHAYAAGIKKGVHVKRGQPLGYVGDSGNAEGTAPHLHFEILNLSNAPIDPYPILKAAQKAETKTLSASAAGTEVAVATESQETPAEDPAVCAPGDMIRTQDNPNVYFCGHDGGRYLFPTEAVFLSWNKDFHEVKFVSDAFMNALPVNGNIGMRK